MIVPPEFVRSLPVLVTETGFRHAGSQYSNDIIRTISDSISRLCYPLSGFHSQAGSLKITIGSFSLLTEQPSEKLAFLSQDFQPKSPHHSH